MVAGAGAGAGVVPGSPAGPPRGGRQCRVTLVDDVIADVRTLVASNGVADSPARQPGDDVTRDVTADAPVAPCNGGGRRSSSDVKVLIVILNFRSLKPSRTISAFSADFLSCINISS